MPAAAPARKPASRQQRNARALERARTAPAAPRRKSGPAVHRPATRRPAPKRAPAPAPQIAAVLVDRVLRGRTWVGVIGVLLAGIVYLNVSVLETNRGIAQNSAKATALEQTNSTLRGQVARLDSAERIQQLAEARGYHLPLPGDVVYVKPSAANGKLAAQQLAAGSPQPAVSATPTAAAPPPAATPPAADSQVPSATVAP